MVFITRILPEVLGYVSGDCLAGDRFVAVCGEQNKRKIGPSVPDTPQKLNSILFGEVIAGDNAVGMVCFDVAEPISNACGCLNNKLRLLGGL